MAVQNFGGGGSFQVSPGISVSEIDLTTVAPAVDTTSGAFAGTFRWGPAFTPTLVTSENDLISKFGKPSNSNPESWFSAANFLSYSNAEYISRAVSEETQFAAVASESGTSASAANSIFNFQDFETKKDNLLSSGPEFIARWVGDLGNSLKVSVCDSANQFESVLNFRTTPEGNSYFDSANTTLNLEVGTSVATVTLFGVASNQTGNTPGPQATAIANLIEVGDLLKVSSAGSQSLKVVAKSAVVVEKDQFQANTGVASFTLTFDRPLILSENVSTPTVTKSWQYASLFDRQPGRSEYVSMNGNTALQIANTSAQLDELHVVVIDEDGAITNAPGTILETFSGISRATDATLSDGSSNYFKNVINNRSQFIWVGADRSGATSANASNVETSSRTKTLSLSLSGGVDVTEAAMPFGAIAKAFDAFAFAEDLDISLIVTGGAKNNSQLANYVIDNIAEVRKDCMVFVSPPKSLVVNNPNAATFITEFRRTVRSTSYAVLDSGYKYQYDKYNDVYRYIPLNADIAGLCVRTDASRDPWFSPAGVSRGSIKNVIKLAFNPNKAERDLLYKNDVNPIITQQGLGTILYGDKTLLGRPSAFDRINVRRLFIVLQKTISVAANSLMFEFNDEFTRASFLNIVEPFLRDVQGRRGIYDFKVVCDETNNTEEVIDSNRFVGDIYVKPARSINFIRLNFVAVRTGIEFSELVS